MTDLYYPLRSLREGHWFKLICGASFQHLPAIRSLVLAYTLAGADCVDVAADPAVIATARAAIDLAANLTTADLAPIDDGRSPRQGSPWLMASFNDGEDPHFRKAEFDPALCPPDCARPCESICPAQAIVFQPTGFQAAGFQAAGFQATDVVISEPLKAGVVSDRCYGCGRCLPICPVQQISTRSYVSTPAAIAPLVLQADVDAIEIHTQVGHFDDFRRLWQAIVPWLGNLKLIAISCPDGDGLFDYLWALYDLISPLPCPLLWQMDGRPMSGDIGTGATRAAVKLGQKALAAGLPGYIQLAGGTNKHTVPKLKALGLLHPQLLDPSTVNADGMMMHRDQCPQASYVAGVAYGSYARTLLTPVLNQLEAIASMTAITMPQKMASAPYIQSPQTRQLSSSAAQNAVVERSEPARLEAVPTLLEEAVILAHSLVSQLKVHI